MSKIEYASVKIDRQHVTLRIPTDIAEAVEKYASENHLRKTDAYVHFLRQGLANGVEPSAIESKLDQIISLLEAGR